MTEWYRDYDLWQSLFHITFSPNEVSIPQSRLDINPEYLEIDFHGLIVSLRPGSLEGTNTRCQGHHHGSVVARLLRLRIIKYYHEECAVFWQKFRKEDDEILQLCQPIIPHNSALGKLTVLGKLTIENQKGINIVMIVFNDAKGNGFGFKPSPTFPLLTVDLVFGLVYTPFESLVYIFRLFASSHTTEKTRKNK